MFPNCKIHASYPPLSSNQKCKLIEKDTKLNLIPDNRTKADMLRMGAIVFRFESVSSTNDVAKTLARKGLPEGTVVLAKMQEQGRGRRDKKWFSPRGGLWFSVILRRKNIALLHVTYPYCCWSFNSQNHSPPLPNRCRLEMAKRCDGRYKKNCRHIDRNVLNR